MSRNMRIIIGLGVVAFIAVIGFALKTEVFDKPGGGADPKVAGVDFKAERIKPNIGADEMFVGKADAPVTIIEYASLGCPHCANFHHDTYPEIKKNYIDTGKARLVFRDFPLGTRATAAAMISHCAGPSKYFGFIDLFFRAQTEWSQAPDATQAMMKIARFGNMKTDAVEACLTNQKMIDKMEASKKVAVDKFGINATPSFVVNGLVVSGAHSYGDFRKLLDAELAKTK